MVENFVIGIVGNGYVGSSVAHGFSPASSGNCEILVYDKNPEKSINSLEETVNKSDFIFVSVPTPMQKDGSIDLGVIRKALSEINEIKNEKNILIIKSTMIPGSTDSLRAEFPDLRIIFNPEFLTEKAAKLDFINQSRIILGGKQEDIEKVEKLYNSRFKCANIIKTDAKTAEFIKYFCNVFFATKVSFMNEMKLIANKSGIDWETAVKGLVSDGRIADSHLSVPGPDGKFGFGGSCFPKDINAFIDFAESLGIDACLIKSAWKTNLKVRPEKDWENLKGRAVSDTS